MERSVDGQSLPDSEIADLARAWNGSMGRPGERTSTGFWKGISKLRKFLKPLKCLIKLHDHDCHTTHSMYPAMYKLERRCGLRTQPACQHRVQVERMESDANWAPQREKVADNIWGALDIDR